jgi:hypothetical protein
MAQIMAVTGHKSALSVAEYQRVSSKEKQVISRGTWEFAELFRCL